MTYKHIFSNRYLHITILTNSRYIHDLTGNFLDLGGRVSCRAPQIKIRFFLEEFQANKARLVPRSLYRNGTVSSWLYDNKDITLTTTSLKKGTVRASIFKGSGYPKEYILDSVLMQPLRFILAYHGFFFVHASMLSKNNNCILISGPKDSGKNTLALTLARHGFALQSDDDCFIKLVNNVIRVFPFRTKMGLNEKIIGRNPYLKKHILKNYKYGEKRRVSLNVFNADSGKSYLCRAAIFPAYKPKKVISIKKMPRARFLKQLTSDSLSLYPEKQAEEMTWTFYSLANKVDAFELSYNDARLNEIPGIINKIAGF